MIVHRIISQCGQCYLKLAVLIANCLEYCEIQGWKLGFCKYCECLGMKLSHLKVYNRRSNIIYQRWCNSIDSDKKFSRCVIETRLGKSLKTRLVLGTTLTTKLNQFWKRQTLFYFGWFCNTNKNIEQRKG